MTVTVTGNILFMPVLVLEYFVNQEVLVKTEELWSPMALDDVVWY
jgi:hypothetical protein